MSSVNKIIILGNLGADPELRYTQGGQAVCNLRVATTEIWNDKDGNKQERTEWHAVSVWGKQGENCAHFLAKGRQVYVEGRLQSREYADKGGVTRKVWEIMGDNVVFLGEGGARQGAASDRGAPQTGGKPQGAGQGQGGGFGGRGGAGGGQRGGGGDWGQGGGGGPRGGGGSGGQRGGGGGFDDDPIPF